MNAKRTSRTALWISSILTITALTFVAFTASAQNKAHDWKKEDVHEKTFDTTKYRGKTLLVFIASDKTRDKMKPISEKLIMRYGENKKVDQVTLLDLDDAPLKWTTVGRATGKVDEECRKALKRTADRLNKARKDEGKKPIPGLKKKLRMVLDWDGDIVKKYKHWPTNKNITIVVVNPQGDIVGSWKGNQLKQVFSAIDATVGN